MVSASSFARARPPRLLTSEPPDYWPPPEAAAPSETEPQGSPVVPMFPLSDVWLFPGLALPLFIFEPRYRQMVEDSLDCAGRIVIGTVQKGHECEMPGAPPIYPIAGMGEIVRHERRPDGCFVILLVGLARVHTEEVPSERLYRQVRSRPVQEHPVEEPREQDLRSRVLGAIRERAGEPQNLREDVPLAHLADLLTLRLPLPHGVTCRLFGELDLERRIEAVLVEHGRRPVKE